MFDGRVFLVSPAGSPHTVAHITQNGGGVVYDLDHRTAVTCVIVADHISTGKTSPSSTASAGRRTRGWATANGLAASLEDRVRASRIPVLYERWVHACLREARLLLPYRDHPDTVAYDPFLFAGLCFTTTQLLPLQLKANIVALMQFYGATYHPALLDTTNLVVYSHMRLVPPCRAEASVSRDTEAGSGAVASHAVDGGGLRSSSAASPTAAAAAAVSNPPPTKLSVARERGVPCVTPQWIQLCLTVGELQPCVAAATAASAGATRSGGASAPRPAILAAAAPDSAAEADTATAAAASELADTHDAVERWIGDVLGPLRESPEASSRANGAACPVPESSHAPGEAQETSVSADELHAAVRLASSSLAATSRKRCRDR